MAPPRIGSAAPRILTPVQHVPARGAPPSAPPSSPLRHVDSFEPAPTRPASRLERSPAFARLSPEVQARVRELGAGASPSAEANLSRVVSARGFSQLPVERQREMLDVYSRHRDDVRVAGGLGRLAGARAFVALDAPAQSAAIRRAAVPERLRGDALAVLNTTAPQHVTVNGVGIDVYGASPSELATIENTLGRLPASHLRTIPRVVVADTIAHGNRASGGGWVPQRSIDAYESGTGASGRNTAAYRAEGWSNLPRLELSHESLGRRDVTRSQLSLTVLHETGHAVDERYGLSSGLTASQLGEVDYNGQGHEAEGDLGPVHERFGDAYMRYYRGTLSSDATAYETMSRALARVPPE